MTEGSSKNSHAEAIEGIRARLHEKIKRETFANGRAAAFPSFPPIKSVELDQLLKLICAAHGRVGTLNPRRAGPINLLIQKFKRLMQRALTWYTRPIAEFQYSTIRYLYKIAEILDAKQSEIDALQKRAESLSAGLAELQRQAGRDRPGSTPGV